MVSLTRRPSIPPWAFTSLAHRLYPRSNAWPSAEKFPVKDSDAPMVIRPVELRDEVWPVVAPVPTLVQATRTPAQRTAGALLANALITNRGRTALTPCFSLAPGSGLVAPEWSDTSRYTRP